MLTLNEPIAKSFARPDIVDRGGRLLATDVEMPSLFADPSLVRECGRGGGAADDGPARNR